MNDGLPDAPATPADRSDRMRRRVGVRSLLVVAAALSMVAASASPAPAAELPVAGAPAPDPATAAVAAQASGFSDVADTSVHRPAVAALAADGVFDGTECGPGLFCPGEPIDRKTVAVWTVRVLTGQDPPTVSQTRFSDVDAESFYAPFVGRMAQLGITTGCGDGTRFCPDRNVTRAEMAAFLSRAYSLADGPDPGFSDVPAGVWYAADTARLAASGITAGCGDGTGFCPGHDTTRAQMATFLWRADQRTDDTPEPPPDTAAANAVTAGAFHSCGLRTEGTIICWGHNGSGQSDAPSGTFTAVTAGDNHSCGLRTDSTVTCWGNNSFTQTDAPSGSFSAITAGKYQSCGLKTNGTITCWGQNQIGQPVLDAPSGSFSAVTAGEDHSCGLKTNGTITCWGNNSLGQADAPSGTYSAVATGEFHACGLRTNRTITCWDEFGQVDALSGTFSAVVAGGFNTCGLRTNGTITCWGDNGFGQADAPDGTYNAVTTNGSHACGLRTEGTITCWGWNELGQADAPSGTFGPAGGAGQRSP